MFGKYVRYKTEEGNEMTNTASTTHRTGKKESRKLSRTMAVILGLIVTLEVMIAGGMIFNIISMVINAAQRGAGNTKIAMYTVGMMLYEQGKFDI